VLAAFYPRLRPIAWGLVAIVGFGRIATGAHFATDVVGGAVVGLLAGMLAMRLQTQFRQTNQAISL
ncbi:MAG: phosphatase PAP2 family protein, partial [Anaerolineae bacterium]|nr:phosphatase PAP2 family protein [Anaerolineae bacterium]